MEIPKDVIATIFRAVLKIGGGILIGHGIVALANDTSSHALISSTDWEALSAGIVAAGTGLVTGLLSAKKDADIKANTNNHG